MKGKVHPKKGNVMFICLHPGHLRCRWLCFFSRRLMKIFNSNRCSLSYSHIMAVKGTHGLESKQCFHNSRSRDSVNNEWRIHVTDRFRACIYYARACWRVAQDVVNVRRTVGHCCGSEVNNFRDKKLCLKTSMYCHKPQDFIWLCLCVFFWLSKPWVPLTAIISLTDFNGLS